MFMDILMTNRPAVLAQLASYLDNLGRLRDLLAAGDEAALSAQLAAAQAARARWKPRR
jgi:prephenate dehydrogenase